MHRASRLLSSLSLLSLAAPAAAGDWQNHAPLPWPIANNAVTAHVLAGTTFVYTFMGIDTTKVWSGIQASAARLNTTTNTWQILPDVPVAVPRIAATAVTVRDSIYVIGGYTVASGGQEDSKQQVRALDPATGTWTPTSPPNMPRGIDDMVTGVYADSLVYVISGWSDGLNVPDVRFFDTTTWTWTTATPLPAFGTFGAVGGVCGDHIVFIDGVADTAALGFDLVNRVLVGTIDPQDASVISWENRGPHPGRPVYRAAGGNLPGDDTRILITGGTDNPYNFDGMGYDGNPSEPLGQTWSYYAETGTVVFHDDNPIPTMDHRGFPAGGDGRLWVVGGMEAGQAVTDLVSSWLPDVVTAAPAPPRAEAAVMEPAPNPTRAGVRFRIRGATTLRDPRILDVAGRVVRTWPPGAHDAGRGFGWDLRDGAGARVPSGVYWLIARIDGRRLAKSVVVLD